MSIASKHAYRFTYLKSEQWETVRLEALAREGGKCQICGEESFFNDAHHVWYPSNVYETTEKHLVVLCRECHNFIHCIIPECKTSDEAKGMAAWEKYKNAIQIWRMEKLGLFSRASGLEGTIPIPAKELRLAYAECKKKCQEQEHIIRAFTAQYGKVPISGLPVEPTAFGFDVLSDRLSMLLVEMKKWSKDYLKSQRSKFPVDDSDFCI